MKKDYSLEKRKYVIAGLLILLVVIYLIRLFELQVFDSKYKENADSNAFLRKTIYPSRGQIFDRKGRLVVFNQPAYDVMVIPREIKPDFDSIDFCNTLQIDIEELRRRFDDMRNPRKNPGYSSYTQQVLITHISAKDYGRLQEKLYRFPGFFIQKRILRQYAYENAANVLGNIREVNDNDIKKDDYYRPGDYTGDLGIEKSYEPYLRGFKGQEILIRDANGRIKGRFENGARDIAPISGKDLTLGIDIDLQAYGEKLMQGKTGAIVAIEPATGEILALVSSPTYNPKMLVGRERGKAYRELMNDPAEPLFDRAIMAAYPPGSTFKPTQGLIFRQEGIVSLSTAYPCYRGYICGRLKVGCHGHESPITLKPALRTSCNAYFCWGFKNMIDRRGKYGSPSQAFEVWKNYMVEQGYGYRLGVDLPGESRGFIPNSKFYNKVYGENGWSANTIISDAIGQGEILATPLQIANLAATIANRGYFYTPHVVKQIHDSVMPKEFLTKRVPKINRQYYEEIVEGMRMAVTGGTCRGAQLRDIEVCGKTGTAQNPHGRDHSAFMGFAPMNNPKIAICVYVENAGFGATFGVPIGSLMMEMYLNGKIAPERQHIEDRMLSTSITLYKKKR
ncbi:MAG: penicillin-binding protein 2 [Bacteroidales bacterium]|nr:penicillin-binding protein 2 [Bacteroidales bacterium]MDY4942933.1 penicillin-binding transpeptidase domain-containing protein [Candidatus Limisoma sp.]